MGFFCWHTLHWHTNLQLAALVQYTRLINDPSADGWGYTQTHTHSAHIQAKLWAHRVLAELRPNTQPFIADKDSFSRAGIPISACISQTHINTTYRHAHTGFVISEKADVTISSASRLRGVTSLRRKKAFYSCCQLVCDWLEGKVVARRTGVMLVERLERMDRVGDGRRWRRGGGSGIWAQESLWLSRKKYNTHTHTHSEG